MVSAFRSHPIVALGMLHRNRNEFDFVVSLIRNPEFDATVNNIEIECANSLYQPLLDRYIAGEDVPLGQLRAVWRNTTQQFFCEADPSTKVLLDTVRAVNRNRPKGHGIRVLAADPPIEWTKIRTTDQLVPFMARRNLANIVVDQVLSKHENALLLIGGNHLFRHHSRYGGGLPTLTELLERRSPHSTYVIMPHDFDQGNAELDRRLATWPVPSIAKLSMTWVGSLDASVEATDLYLVSNPSKPVRMFPGLHLQDLADAYLYLGPFSALRWIELREPTDPAFLRELQRRRSLFPGRAKRVAP
ncbi:MAG: hypothetical protein M3Z37_07720 [Candidatus Eremiobacteraeota bacterium]|nr:hypothetical protein [Candidatus Eremiobacteraeota bacterium]